MDQLALASSAVMTVTVLVPAVPMANAEVLVPASRVSGSRSMTTVLGSLASVTVRSISPGATVRYLLAFG